MAANCPHRASACTPSLSQKFSGASALPWRRGPTARQRVGIRGEAARLRADYIAGLPGQVARLAQALARQDRAAAQDIIHQMRGTAGMFGLDWVTYAAMPIDEHLQAGHDLSAVAPGIRELIDRLRCVEGYLRDREAPP